MWIQVSVTLLMFFSDNDLLPGGTQAFSSYPGSIFSGDDFYILSSGLVRTLCTWHDRIECYTLKRIKFQYLNVLLFYYMEFIVLNTSCFCRLLWKLPLATATLLSGSLFSPQEPSWNGWGTSWLIDWPLLAKSGPKYSARTTVEREYHTPERNQGLITF